MSSWRSDYYMIAADELIECEEMKAKQEKEKIKELKVVHDGRHIDGWCVMYGNEMVVTRHNDEEAAQVVCAKLNNLMQRRR